MLSAMVLRVAADKFYIEDMTIAPGSTVEVQLLLDNESIFTAFQADVTLSEGLSVNPDALNYGFVLTGRKGNHLLIVNRMTDDTYRVVSYSAGLDIYKGDSGALLTVDVTADAALHDTAAITLTNVRFTTPEAVEVMLEDQTCTLTVAWLRGDVNDDGDVNINDIVQLIDYLLNNDISINFYNADVYTDGEVTVSDVVVLIDFLLARSWPV